MTVLHDIFKTRLLAALLLLAAVVSCTVELQPDGPAAPSSGDGISIPLALSVTSGCISPVTKMSETVTQVADNSWRGIYRVYVIPFSTTSSIGPGDTRFDDNLLLPQTYLDAQFNNSALEGMWAGLVTGNNAHLYNNVYVRTGTSSVLVYGQADGALTTTAQKHTYGVLNQTGLENAEHPAEITFSLEPIVSDAVNTNIDNALSGLLTYLTSIANTSYSINNYYGTSGGTHNSNPSTLTWTWSNTGGTQTYTNNTLTNCFNYLTASSFPCTASAINAMLTKLYNDLYQLTSNSDRLTYYTSAGSWFSNPTADCYYIRELANAIRSEIANTTYVNPPSGSGSNVTITLKTAYQFNASTYGIPEGSVAVKWNGSTFVRQSNTLANSLVPVNAYCYPPSLWYWSNSILRTTTDESIASQYTTSANATWADIVARYTQGSTVRNGITSAAVKEPLHYGVGLLKLNLNQCSSPLKDSKNNNVAVNNTNFPLTGIIVADQKNQAFNFTPKSGQNYYIYDTEVSGAYISSSATSTGQQTLVVQTETGADVHFALEFQNNSGSDFYGVNGNLILKNSRFYLVGMLRMSDASSNPDGLTSIFVQDHTTELTITFTSLAKAYNTVPELREPQLEIGVQTQMDWIQSTPAEVPMY